MPKTTTNRALVYITPPGGVGGEFPVPIPFNLGHYSRKFVKNYARACEAIGQKVRIVWPKPKRG